MYVCVGGVARGGGVYILAHEYICMCVLGV